MSETLMDSLQRAYLLTCNTQTHTPIIGRSDLSYGAILQTADIVIYHLVLFYRQLRLWSVIWCYSMDSWDCDLSYGAILQTADIVIFHMVLFYRQLTLGFVIWCYSTDNWDWDLSYGAILQTTDIRICHMMLFYRKLRLGSTTYGL